MATAPTGTLIAIAIAFGATKNVTAVTNEAEAKLTITAHGYSAGDIFQIYSGWGRLNRRVARVKSVVSPDQIVAEQIDTSNTDFFPPGSGIGTVRKITTWQQINKYSGLQSNGGDPKNITVKWMDSDVEESLNDGFTAVTESWNIDADQVGQPDYEALRTFTEVQTDTVLKKTLKTGSKVYTPGRVALNENVKFQDGQVNVCPVAWNANGRITRYAN